MNQVFWMFLALLAGAVLPIQGGLNARLGKAAASPVHAALASFVVGTAGLVLYLAISQQPVSWAGLKAAPVQWWLGGLLGAFYVATVVFLFPRLGPGLTFSLVVAGQLVLALLLDHYHVLVAHPAPITALKVLGLVLVLVGVALIRR